MRKNESFYRNFKTSRIHPWIPELYRKKLKYIQSQTGLHQEELITLAIYVFLSYVAKKVKQGEDLYQLIIELRQKCVKNLEHLEGKND